MNQAMTTKSLDAIDHVAVSVNDIAGAVDWYTSHFSCDIA